VTCEEEARVARVDILASCVSGKVDLFRYFSRATSD
jgi:hypothetical protein